MLNRAIAALMLASIWMVVGTAGAQERDGMIEMSSLDGRVTMQMPADWSGGIESGMIVMANSPVALARGHLLEGEMQISVLPPALLLELGIEAAAAEAVVKAVMERRDAVGAPQRYRHAGVRGAWALVIRDSGRAGQIMALEFETGTVALLVDYGSEFPDNAAWYLEQLHEIVGTIALDGQSASVHVTPMPAVDAEPVRQWAASVTGTSQFTETSWGFMQAAGAPDTDDCGDRQTAWASEKPSGEEMLQLIYEQPVFVTQIHVYQTQSPGGIVWIDLINTETGDVYHIEDSHDPVGNTPCPGVFTVDVPLLDLPMNSVAIFLDQQEVGWNEIDAVELVGLPVNTAGDAGGGPADTTDSGTGREPLTEANAVTAGDWTLLHRAEIDGEYMIDYPAGWLLDFDGPPLVATSEEAVNDMRYDGGPLGEGEIAIGILSPSMYEQLGVAGPSNAPDEVLAAVVAAVGGTGSEILPLDEAPMPASYVLVETAEYLMTPSYLAAFAHESGVYTFVVVTDDFEAVRPLLVGMMGTVTTP